MFVLLSTGFILNVNLIKLISPEVDKDGITEIEMVDGKILGINQDDRMMIASFGLGGKRFVPDAVPV